MPKTYQHLQLEERALIQTMLEQGYKAAAIALSLGCCIEIKARKKSL